jgi:NAD(P)H dehydrogenase (quinone)
MIVITGATGAYGGAVLAHLLDRMPPSGIAVSVRDPGRVRELEDRGVRVRTGSYEDPDALERSFEGAEQVLIVSSSDPHADQDALHRAAVDAAVRAGAARILYTSHQNARADSPFMAAPHHAASEAALAASGVAWTSLRNGFYAHSLQWLLGPWRSTGTITAPVDGPVSWTDRDDQAEAAARILAGERSFDGPVTLTAGDAPTFADLAVTAGGILGRPVERVVQDDEEWVAAQVAHGAPEGSARFLLGFFHAARRDDFAEVQPTLAEILGREPRSVRDLLAAGTTG